MTLTAEQRGIIGRYCVELCERWGRSMEDLRLVRAGNKRPGIVKLRHDLARELYAYIWKGTPGFEGGMQKLTAEDAKPNPKYWRHLTEMDIAGFVGVTHGVVSRAIGLKKSHPAKKSGTIDVHESVQTPIR